MRALSGVVQHYAWGSTDDIPNVLGREPDGRPWAEWWLGTHAGGPGTLDDGSDLVSTSGELPYLVKLLAAAEPLSLQTHPTRAQAAEGFADEERRGIPIHAPNRIYRDPFAKPEILVALTPFDALTGFRPVAATIELLEGLGAHRLAASLAQHGLQATVEALYRGQLGGGETVRACRRAPSPEAALVTRLSNQYPDDPSVVVTLLLNRVTLTVGEAVYLPPGNLHAYVRGFGVEVMGASDNVVRGGLTVKHVDVATLLATLDFTPLDQPVVSAAQDGPGEFHYATPGAPFLVRRIDVVGDHSATADGPEIWLALRTGEPAQAWYLGRGDRGTVTGPATLFRVTASARPLM